MVTGRATVTVEIPRGLIELLYLRAASGLDDSGGVPPVDARHPTRATQPISESDWTSLWAREVAQLGDGMAPSQSTTVRDRVLAAGTDLDDLRTWVNEVVQKLTSDMMRNARHDVAMADEERGLTGGRTIGVIPVKDDLLLLAGPRLVLVSHHLRTRPKVYLAKLRELQS
jgi:hypothetical protein